MTKHLIQMHVFSCMLVSVQMPTTTTMMNKNVVATDNATCIDIVRFEHLFRLGLYIQNIQTFYIYTFLNDFWSRFSRVNCTNKFFYIKLFKVFVYFLKTLFKVFSVQLICK